MKKPLILAVAVFLGLVIFYSGEYAQRQVMRPEKVRRNYTECSRIVICSKAIEALGRIGDPSALKVVGAALKSRNATIRASAVEALNRIHDKSSVALLKERLSDRSPIVRVLAVKALLNFGEPGMEPRLLSFLNSRDASIRALAVEQLGEFKYKYLDRINAVFAQDKSNLVRLRAIQQLGINQFNPAMGSIEKALSDPDPRIRQAACVAIGQLRDPARFRYLNDMLRDPVVSVRSAAKIGMSQKIKAVPGPAGKDELMEALKADLDSNDPVLKVSSFLGLASLHDITLVPLLLQEVVTEKNPSFVKKGAAKALFILKPYVAQSLDQIGKGVITSNNLDISYKVNGKNLVSLVIASLEDKKSPLHEDSVFILGELREDSSLPALRAALLRDDDPDIAANSAYVLGLFGDKGAVTSLIGLCENYCK